MSCGGGCEAAVTARTRCSLVKDRKRDNDLVCIFE